MIINDNSNINIIVIVIVTVIANSKHRQIAFIGSKFSHRFLISARCVCLSAGMDCYGSVERVHRKLLLLLFLLLRYYYCYYCCYHYFYYYHVSTKISLSNCGLLQHNNKLYYKPFI